MACERKGKTQTNFNEFITMMEYKPKKNPQRFTAGHSQKIKIMNKKLPSDFFIPNSQVNNILNNAQNREDTIKTPCFGQQKKQSHSVTLITNKEKITTESNERLRTLPIQESVSKNVQVSNTERHSKTREKIRKNNKHLIHQEHKLKKFFQRQKHQSIDRQKIRFSQKIHSNPNQTINRIFERDFSIKFNLNIKNLFSEKNQFLTYKKMQPCGEKPQSQRLPPIQ